jgi:hypothetical protein
MLAPRHLLSNLKVSALPLFKKLPSVAVRICVAFKSVTFEKTTHLCFCLTYLLKISTSTQLQYDNIFIVEF